MILNIGFSYLIAPENFTDWEESNRVISEYMSSEKQNKELKDSVKKKKKKKTDISFVFERRSTVIIIATASLTEY